MTRPPISDSPHASTRPRFRLHLGRYADETAPLCRLAPAAVPRTRSLVRSARHRRHRQHRAATDPSAVSTAATDHEVLALLAAVTDASPYDLVRETWRPQAGGDFEGWWSRALARRRHRRKRRSRWPRSAQPSFLTFRSRNGCRRHTITLVLSPIHAFGTARSPTMPGCRNARSR